jgi:hypothetical protein
VVQDDNVDGASRNRSVSASTTKGDNIDWVYAGQRVLLRMDGTVTQVMDEQRLLLAALPCPLPATARGRPRGTSDELFGLALGVRRTGVWRKWLAARRSPPISRC